MLVTYELRWRLKEIAIYVSAAVMAVKTIKCGDKQSTQDGIEAILAFLEKAAVDLEQLTSAQPKIPPHRETIFPNRSMALKAIEKLQFDETVGFQLTRDGEGRCSVRMWLAGDAD
jgi:hypothetical protein